MSRLGVVEDPAAEEAKSPPHAPSLSRVIAVARSEALLHDHELVGTHHLLLALARLADRPVGQALASAGVTRNTLRNCSPGGASMRRK